ncbi:MAG: cyclic nucleotide-binding domain-containing protein, partial [Acidobacteria bacterium]|nr:cyclic nucleotide-binding domain-containing protein [Acidobacteriota bacterium]
SQQTLPDLDSITDKLVPINGLDPEHRRQLIERARLVRYREGEYVFKQGDRDELSLYLLQGELELSSSVGQLSTVSAGSAEASYTLAQLQPRQVSGRAKSAVTILEIHRPLLEQFINLSSQCAVDKSGSETEGNDSVDWVSVLLESPLFNQLPASSLQRIFPILDPVYARAGEEIVSQGSVGDYYYIVCEGRCAVKRKIPNTEKQVVLAELAAGDRFGEEALLGGGRRSASVMMLTDGQLLRLNRDDFISLIKAPLLTSVDYKRAQELIREGALWLDVRFPNEHTDSGIEGSLNLPLVDIRRKAEGLDKGRRYVVYCDTGARGVVGTFLLAERGFDVSHLEGGLITTGRLQEASLDTTNSFVLKEELEKTSAELRKALNLKEQAEAEKRAAEVAADEELRAERTRMEKEAKRINEALSHAQRLREKVKVSHQSFKQKLQAERERLEQEADRVTLELFKAHHMREKLKAAEQMEREKLRAKREELERESKRVTAELDQAQRVREQIKDAKKAVEKKLRVEHQRLDHEADRVTLELFKAHQMREDLKADEKLAKERLRAKEEELMQESKRVSAQLSETQHMKEEVEVQRKLVAAQMQECQQERERIHQLNEETKKRLREQEVRTAAMYAQKEEELKKARMFRQEVEEQLRAERERLAAQAEEAKRKLSEARRIERVMEMARLAAAEEEGQIQERQRYLDQRLREEYEEKLAEERKKLEQEFSRNAEQLALARKEKAAAEAASRAAALEAERIIAQYKATYQRKQEEQQASLRAERERLERETAKLRQELQRAALIKEEAIRIKQAAEEELARVRKDQEATSGAKKADVEAQVTAMETELSEANRNLAAAQRAQAQAEAAEQANREKLELQQQTEELLRTRIETDIQEWVKEQEAFWSSDEQRRLLQGREQAMRRIKQEEAEEKRRIKEHDQRLLTEIEAMLE